MITVGIKDTVKAKKKKRKKEIFNETHAIFFFLITNSLSINLTLVVWTLRYFLYGSLIGCYNWHSIHGHPPSFHFMPS